jgi:integrase
VRFRVRIMTGREVQGEAWASKRPALADHWWVVVTGEGRRERIHVGADREAAERKAGQLERALEARDGAVLGSGAPTLREVRDDYLRRAERRVSPTTLRTRRHQLEHLCAALGECRVDRLRPEMLTGWWSEYVEEGKRSPRSGHGHLEALARALGDAEFHGVTVAPALAALAAARRMIRHRGRGTKQSRRRDPGLDVRPLTPAQAAALGDALESWTDHDARLFAVLGLDCGLRLGELLALVWSDFDGERLRVHRSLDALGNVGPTKTGRERVVEVSRRARRMLKERRMECGARARAGSRVLRHVTRVVYRKRLAALARAAGVEAELLPTTLRHTFGSLLVMAGVPLSYVAAQLGHASIAVTERHYARWIPGEGYRTPPELAEGEVPADLLARLATTLPTPATIGGKAER